MTPSFSRLWSVALLLAAFLTALLANLWLVPTSFSVEAVTEIVRLDLPAAYMFSWKFDNVSIITDLGKSPSAVADAVFRPAQNVTLLVERISNGPLLIRCESHVPTGSCGEFRTRAESRTLGADVSFIVNGTTDADKMHMVPVVLPFQAHAELGNHLDLSDELPDPAMLLKAHVRMLGRTFFGDRLFDGGTIDAGAGDYLEVYGERGTGVGFIRVSNEAGLTVAYRVVGRSISVTRLRSRGYAANTSIYARIMQDTSLQVLWAGLLAFCAIFKRASESVRNAFDATKEHKTISKTS